MTIRAMEKFGVRVSQDEPMLYKVPAGSYEPAIFQIEADATSSAYILASAWILNKEVKIINLPSDTLQGDIIFDEILEKMKEEGKLVLDLNQNPDLVPAAVAVSIFRNGETEIVNVKHLKNKESDRLSVLCSQLALLNADIHETEHGLVIKPSHLHGNAVLNPHEDHRMAMAFAITGLRLPDIEILDKKCVSKSFPDFFEIMEKIR
jgi:3-phosphoshikimate 1-carboxyvinyltransferase